MAIIAEDIEVKPPQQAIRPAFCPVWGRLGIYICVEGRNFLITEPAAVVETALRRLYWDKRDRRHPFVCKIYPLGFKPAGDLPFHLLNVNPETDKLVITELSAAHENT